MGETSDKEYLELFLEEARDYIDSLNELLPKLEKNMENLEVINEVFRLMHSLKGNARMLGLENISKLAHKAEDLLAIVRDGRLKLTKEHVKLLFRVLDKLNEMLSLVEEKATDKEADISEILKELEKALAIEEKSEASVSTEKAKEALEFLRKLALSEEKPKEVFEALENVSKSFNKISKHEVSEESKNIEDEDADKELFKLSNVEREKALDALARGLQFYKITLKFKETPMFVLRYFVALQKIGELGEIIKTIPSGSEVSQTKTYRVTILAAVRKLNELDEVAKEIPDLESYDARKVEIEALGLREDEVSMKVESTADKLAEIENLLKKVEEKEAETKSLLAEEQQQSQKLGEVRVNVKSLDTLFNLVGELVLVKSRLAAIISKYDIPNIKETLATFERLVSELQDEVMRMRLVPLQYVFRNIPRYVSELSEKYGREVDVYFEGSEISLDRKVLEDLAEPLFKLIEILIRDDVEKAEERSRKGKPSVGTIRLVAAREGNHVILTVESDGRGIDAEEVKKRAVELGLVPATTVEKMGKEEALMLTTLPGFSLRNGAWSGLDSIKKAVEALGGTLEIYSKVDAETKFLFKIPVSMATLRALLVKLGTTPYAIPVTSVITTIKLTDRGSVGQADVVKYQDKILPIYDLACLLGIDGATDKKYAVIVEKRGKLVALAVDEILGQEDIVVKPLSRILARTKGLAGATILGDGRVCLILDPLSLIP